MRIRTVLTLIAIVLALAAALWVFGPREPVDTTIRFSPEVIGEDLDAYLARTEAEVDDLRDIAAKQIVWAFPASRARTPVSLVYLHGFSATKGELRPVPDMAAERLDANLYFARLTGHGRNGSAMAEATVQDWIDDTAEAIAIAERLGEHVVIIGTSTGGTLAAVAALHPDLRNRIAGIVFVAPNFGVKASGSQLLAAPFARTLVPLIVGETRGFEPINPAHARYWTTSYPSVALVPMAALVRHARGLIVEDADIPALFVFSDSDQVVDHAVTRRIAERWGADAEIVAVAETGDPFDHIIAGDVLSPANNEPVAALIADWVRSLDLPR
nr:MULTISPECIES: alpha/beta fold hydrolase [unclassified Roseitalea]